MAGVAVTLRWSGEGLRFDGETGTGAGIHVDGDGRAAPSPMQTLLAALAGCMGADVVEILGKMRVPLESLVVRIQGDRALEPPRRYTSLRVTFETRGIGDEAEERLRRAIALSREKYCSVLHSLQPDLDLGIEAVRG